MGISRKTCCNGVMKLISINVAQAREVEFEGRMVSSGIWKQPLSGSVDVGETNLDGDQQANLEVHGGIHKAVYAYSFDHYAWWQNELGRDDLSAGMFGENLTISGLDEKDICIGDQWRVGNVHFAVTSPRIPCSNLAMKFADKSLPRRFTQAGRPGVYLKVMQTGAVTAGDLVEVIEKSGAVTIRDLYRAYTKPAETGSASILTSAMENPFLDPDMVAGITKRLKAVGTAE
jgi:MOSC domain-containing protein YiiM